MNKAFIFYIVGVAVLALGMAYQHVQQGNLENTLAEANTECELRLSSLEASLRADNSPANTHYANQTAVLKKAVVKTMEPTALVQAAKNDEKPLLQVASESLDDIVRRKYRFLLAHLQLSEEQIRELITMLKQREQIHLRLLDAEEFADELNIDKNEIADLRYELEILDEQIRALMGGEEDASRFVVLKNSDEEQHEFSQYTLDINGLFPLNQQQQEKVLFTRLSHKQAFDKTLEDLGLDMDFPLTYDQQQEMLGKVDYALYKYKEVYLNGVKPHLEVDDTPMNQYRLLENYTNTEFEQLREEIHKRIQERGVINP